MNPSSSLKIFGNLLQTNCQTLEDVYKGNFGNHDIGSIYRSLGNHIKVNSFCLWVMIWTVEKTITSYTPEFLEAVSSWFW